jgi:hypothetical protein
LLAAGDPTTDRVGDRMVTVPAPYARDKADLLAGVAGTLRCRSVRWRADDGFATHLFGFASDLERVEVLFTSLLVQAAYGMAAAVVPEWEHPAAFRRSWLEGFRWAVVQRLRESERRAEQAAAGPSTALALADRSDRVAQRLAEAYPRVRTAPPRRLSGGGLEGGLSAGRSADLGGVRVADRRRAKREIA